jgi:hypothetical protein
MSNSVGSRASLEKEVSKKGPRAGRDPREKNQSNELGDCHTEKLGVRQRRHDESAARKRPDAILVESLRTQLRIEEVRGILGLCIVLNDVLLYRRLLRSLIGKQTQNFAIASRNW